MLSNKPYGMEPMEGSKNYVTYGKINCHPKIITFLTIFNKGNGLIGEAVTFL